VIFDLEHTGGKRPSIIQIAAIWADANGKYDKATAFKELVHTSKPIHEKAGAVHRINAEMLTGKDGFALVGARFVEWIERRARTARGARVLCLVAHGGFSSDCRYLAIELAAANLALPAASWLCLDTLDLLRKLPRLPLHAATPDEFPDRRKLTKKEADAGKTFGKRASSCRCRARAEAA
jgi:DNA polymerase III epsilon subunit-like protein